MNHLQIRYREDGKQTDGNQPLNLGWISKGFLWLLNWWMGFGLRGLKSLYNGKTFKVNMQFPGENPRLFPKLTTVLARGREAGRNIRQWLKADCHRKFTAMWRKPGILVSGGDSPWALVCVKANEWWEETPQEFSHLLFVFQKCKYNSQALSAEMNGQTSKNKEKR